MSEFRALWRDHWIGAVHVPTNQQFGFGIQEEEDGTIRLIGGVVMGSDDGAFDAQLHAAALEFARAEVESRQGKKVRS